MTSNEKNCLFCKGIVTDGFSIFGQIGDAENASEIIEQHFWFDINSTDFEYHYVCIDCWEHVKTFHEFYRMVETVHNKHLVEDDKSRSSYSDPEDYESEDSLSPNEVDEMCGFEETIIGLEIHTLDTEIASIDEYLNQPPKESEFEIETIETAIEEVHNDQESIVDSSIVDSSIFDSSVEDSQSVSDYKVTDQKSNVKRKRGRPKKSETKQQNGTTEKKKVGRKKVELPYIEQIVCYICHREFRSFKYLKRHLLLHDSKDTFRFECDLCGKKYPHQNLLKRHIGRSHETPGKYRYSCNFETNCPICNVPLKQGSVKAHIARIHESDPGRPYICDRCGKVFHCHANLMQHKLIHLDRKLTRAQCKICGKWMKNRHILRTHSLLHEKAKSEKCPYCDKVKVGQRALLSHIAVAHTQPKHPCTLCDKSFTRPLALKEHMAVHTGVPLYNCPYCTRTFKNNANMYKHLKAGHTKQWEKDRAERAKKNIDE